MISMFLFLLTGFLHIVMIKTKLTYSPTLLKNKMAAIKYPKNPFSGIFLALSVILIRFWDLDIC